MRGPLFLEIPEKMPPVTRAQDAAQQGGKLLAQGKTLEVALRHALEASEHDEAK
jgi:hypothetical protein